MPDFVEVDGNHEGRCAHAGGCSGGLAACMTGTDDDDVVDMWVECRFVHGMLVCLIGAAQSMIGLRESALFSIQLYHADHDLHAKIRL